MKNKEFEKWAMPIILKAAKIVLVEHFYPVKLVWKKKICDGAMAGFAFSHPYQRMEIQYSNDLIKEWKEEKDSAKGILVHEVCHALTDPLYNAGFQRFPSKHQLEDEREKLTDHIANIILKNIKI